MSYSINKLISIGILLVGVIASNLGFLLIVYYFESDKMSLILSYNDKNIKQVQYSIMFLIDQQILPILGTLFLILRLQIGGSHTLENNLRFGTSSKLLPIFAPYLLVCEGL